MYIFRPQVYTRKDKATSPPVPVQQMEPFTYIDTVSGAKATIPVGTNADYPVLGLNSADTNKDIYAPTGSVPPN